MKAVVLALALACLVGGTAGAQNATAAAAFKDGQRRYVDGDYTGAALQFKAAYAADPDPVYLFNVAQAFRLAKQCAQAAAYYRYYLGSVDKAPNEAAVNTYIDEVDACASQQPAVEVDPDPGRPVAVPVVAPPEQEPVITPPVDRPAPDDPGKLRRRIGVGVAGAGLALAAAGFYFMYQVGQDESDRNALCPPGCRWSKGLDEDARAIDDRAARHQKYMAVGFIAGGAALAGGIVLYLTGRQAAEHRVAISPTGTGAMVSVKF